MAQVEIAAAKMEKLTDQRGYYWSGIKINTFKLINDIFQSKQKKYKLLILASNISDKNLLRNCILFWAKSFACL